VVNQEEYRANIGRLMRFLEGHTDEVLADLGRRMEEAAGNLQFERAARFRDQLRAIRMLIESRRVIQPNGPDQDVVGFAQSNGDAIVQVFFIRQGVLIGRESYPIENVLQEDTTEVIESFVQQFYDRAAFVPPEIILPVAPENHQVLERWLSERRGKKAVLAIPQRGRKRDLVQMATDNAAEVLGVLKVQWQADTLRQEGALRELQDALDLPRLPNRIECYDISTTQGTAIVASRVVFARGVPRKAEYRHFNIKSVTHEGSDDYQSMREALTRRFRRYVDLRDEPAASRPGQKDTEETWRLLPDLLMIDGGKGQLGVAVEVLTEFNLFDQVPVVGLPSRTRSCTCPAAASRCCCRAAPQPCSWSSACATRPTASPSPATAIAAPRKAWPPNWKPCPVSAPRSARRCWMHSANRSIASAAPRQKNWPPCRASRPISRRPSKRCCRQAGSLQRPAVSEGKKRARQADLDRPSNCGHPINPRPAGVG
jgi:excinuclease ABC subunit C